MPKELVEFVVKSIVDNPGAVHVTAIKRQAVTKIEVAVAEADTGRVIGKNGRVINAIRTLVQVQKGRSNKQISIELVTRR